MYIKRNVCKILHNCNDDVDELETFSIDDDCNIKHDETNSINQSIRDDIGAREENLQFQKEQEKSYHQQKQQIMDSSQVTTLPLKKRILQRNHNRQQKQQQRHRTNELNSLLDLHLRMIYLERCTGVVQLRKNKTLLK